MPRWLILLVFIFLVIPTLCFLLFSAALLVFIYWPSLRGETQFDTEMFLALTNDSQSVVLITHGVKDNATDWVEPMAEAFMELAVYEQAIAFDWGQHAENSLRCASVATQIGERVGKLLADNQDLKRVHLIGHSCGAFIVHKACTELTARRPEIDIQNTFLDPVAVYGLSWDYGVEHFGSCGDYSEAYIDVEDSVPGSNVPLPHAYTYDVTEARKISNRNVAPHLWPTQYYLSLVKNNSAPNYFQNPQLQQEKPAGQGEAVFQ
jgi:hypothetical protein